MSGRDPFEILRRTNPVDAGDLPDADSAEGEALLSAILDRARDEDRLTSLARLRSRLRARARAGLLATRADRTRAARVALVAGTIILAAAAAILALVELPGGGQSAAAASLRSVAAVARAQSPLEIPSRRFVYIRTTDAVLFSNKIDERHVPPVTLLVAQTRWPFSARVPRSTEVWLGSAGGRLVQRSQEPEFPSARDRRGWIDAGRPQLTRPAQEVTLDAPTPLAIPSEPDQLYNVLKDDAQRRGPFWREAMFQAVGNLLHDITATPSQREALYEVAARIPGVVLIGEAIDPDGRPGVAVGMPVERAGIRHTLIFDPETSALLAEEQTTLRGSAWAYPAGTLIGYATYHIGGVVDSDHTRP